MSPAAAARTCLRLLPLCSALLTTLLLLLASRCGEADGAPFFPFPFATTTNFNTSFAQQLLATKLQNKIDILDVFINKFPVNTVTNTNTVTNVTTTNTGR